jgi:hypothetical protein
VVQSPEHERAGEEASEAEIDIARQFSREAGARIEARLALLSENRDERLRRIARRPAVAMRGRSGPERPAAAR